jgi:hypothetical protein
LRIKENIASIKEHEGMRIEGLMLGMQMLNMFGSRNTSLFG